MGTGHNVRCLTGWTVCTKAEREIMQSSVSPPIILCVLRVCVDVFRAEKAVSPCPCIPVCVPCPPTVIVIVASEAFPSSLCITSTKSAPLKMQETQLLT